MNLPGAELVEATDWRGLPSVKRTDKGQVFETFAGELENAPMIKACRLTAECRVVKTVEFPVDTVSFGEVTSVHVDEAAREDGAPDRSRIAPLVFTLPRQGVLDAGEPCGGSVERREKVWTLKRYSQTCGLIEKIIGQDSIFELR